MGAGVTTTTGGVWAVVGAFEAGGVETVGAGVAVDAGRSAAAASFVLWGVLWGVLWDVVWAVAGRVAAGAV